MSKRGFRKQDQLGTDNSPQFDISIDGGASKIVLWRSVWLPWSLTLGAPGDHSAIIRANQLHFNTTNNPYPLNQNVILEIAPDPVHDAWMAIEVS
jgi:hypothetical protein